MYRDTDAHSQTHKHTYRHTQYTRLGIQATHGKTQKLASAPFHVLNRGQEKLRLKGILVNSTLLLTF